MKPEQDSYPVFEANQVLTSGHLNDGFNYLDEQEHQTRARLIGIGIACGLEIRLLGGTTIEVSKGCGVTSQGYLMVEPEAVSLVAYRADYRIPDEVDYPVFRDAEKQQYPLWELFPAGEPNTLELASVAGFLDDKAVLLFMELKQQGLRNCSPNNCDDKGSEVAVSVRRLLIKREHLDLISAAAAQLAAGLTSRDRQEREQAQLDLPDLRLPRLAFPRPNELRSQDILAAFVNVFQANQLAQGLGEALQAAYQAFRPWLQEEYPDDPFSDFAAKFGFLDQVLVADTTTTVQARFLPYYYDAFDDLLRAYDEFRWQASGLICACCPPVDLFARHLMLGLPSDSTDALPGIYRHGFLASPAISGCAEKTKEVRLLFKRIVEMLASFTAAPPLFAGLSEIDERIDPQIRITPSVLGGKPLAERAIPYYYEQTGKPPLYEIWNGEKTRRNRGNRNLAYRAYEYRPEPPRFVRDPLSYDFEAYDFLRIEGHLGKPYLAVMRTLLQLKQTYRLPIEIIALRSGPYDEQQTVDLSAESCRFQDLEAVFDALREQVLSALAEGVRFLYAIPLEGEQVGGGALPGGTPQLALLKAYAADFSYAADSVGAWFEKYLKLFQARPYVDVDHSQINEEAVLRVVWELLAGTSKSPLPSRYYGHIVVLYYLSKLAETLPPSLDLLSQADFENKCQDLLGLVRFFRSPAASAISQELKAFIPEDDLIDHFDQVLSSCQLAPLQSVHGEYGRRIGELKKKQFLVRFIADHPGMEHKAGVPLGGTFILVYHGVPAPALASTPAVAERTLSSPDDSRRAVVSVAGASVETRELADAISRISHNESLLSNPDINLLLDSLVGKPQGISSETGFAARLTKGDSRSLIDTVGDELAAGTVIADFYLPYLCCSDCSAIQFVVPRIPPTFTATVACTNAEGYATVSVAPQRGFPPYTVKVDDENHQNLSQELLLSVGQHTLLIRDSESTESAPQKVTVAPHLLFGEPSFVCSEDYSSYRVSLTITGGTPPYRVDGQAIEGDHHTSAPIDSGTAVNLEVLDSRDCAAAISFTHSCVRPCDFSFSVGCTDASDSAPVIVTPTGGIAPYTLMVDEQDYQPLPEILVLNSGEHTLTLRDSEGRQSPVRNVYVAPQLLFGEPSFDCGEDYSSYRASLTISGGIPPYRVNGQAIDGDGYTSEWIDSGTAVDLEVLDSRDCAAAISLTHTCVQACDFSFSVGCTDAEDTAPVMVTPTGGIAPYTLMVDEEAYQPLPAILILSSGEHTLTLRDSEGSESPARGVEVAQHLFLDEPAFFCSEDGSTYTATFTFGGGTPPYFVDGGKLAEGLFMYTTAPIGSGASSEFELVDSRNCSAKAAFTHSCEAACDLPCAGISLDRGYRFWLPDPDPKRPYTSVGFEVAEFSLEISAGERLDLSAQLSEILQVEDIDQLNENFADLVKQWLSRINELIAGITGNPDWLKLSYQALSPGFMGTLRIEYFECLGFDFRIQSFVQRGEESDDLDVAYLPEGTSIRRKAIEGNAIIVPAFDAIRIDKCHPETKPERLCPDDLNLKLEIDVSVDGRGALLKASATGDEQPVAYLWEAQDGQPPLANGDSGWFEFTGDAGPISKRVRVTAFTKRGCRSSRETTINFEELG
ncbi:MAG: hypothetical protein DVS81_11100 [Candidatus Accumulibacter meliphilus]|uniref:Uncharacterized protein n=1 Tax=Candidatus Accumulibacter meliphilus TaxID=2211374 RepID=A0A369XNL9_9PROT|nr:MAG: hypothetical protein DVS81_11100 [Candidatus Accumulibacter meliphilus]